MPIESLNVSSSNRDIGRSLMRISPCCGSIAPIASLRSVVLPEPFAPMIAVEVPARKVVEKLLMTLFPLGYANVALRNSILFIDLIVSLSLLRGE